MISNTSKLSKQFPVALILVYFISSTSGRCVASGKSTPSGPSPITISHASQLHQNLITGVITATGDVHVIYVDGVDHSPITIEADKFVWNTKVETADAPGQVRVLFSDGTFFGNDLHLDLKTESGSINNAIVESDYFTMKGKRIVAKPGGIFQMQDGTFTTCIRAHPDYHIHAHELTITPRKSVEGRDVTFYVGPTKLITLPRYKYSLSSGSGVPAPLPGYNSTDGLYVGIHRTPILDIHHSLDANVRLNFKKLPTGTITYQQDLLPTPSNVAPPLTAARGIDNPLRSTLGQLVEPIYSNYSENSFETQFTPRAIGFGLIQNQSYVYNRNVNDLIVSRLPEVGVEFVNVLGHSFDSTKLDQNTQIGGTEAAIKRIPGTPLLLNVRLAMGYYMQQPFNTNAARLSMRIRAAGQPILLDHTLSLRFGLSEWANLYSTGTAYNILSPETELDYVPTSTSRIAVLYRYLGATSNTPVLVDRRDVRNDMRILYQVGGPWAFGFLSYIDLDHSRAYDGEFAVLRNFDCMQVGLSYRLRNQQIGIIFNLLPPTANRQRLMPINNISGQ